PRLSLYLTSFPTRRSSDLNKDSMVNASLGRPVSRAIRSAVYVAYSLSVLRVRDVGNQMPGANSSHSIETSEVRFPLLSYADLWVDRKSTRLNSSHVKISYA